MPLGILDYLSLLKLYDCHVVADVGAAIDYLEAIKGDMPASPESRLFFLESLNVLVEPTARAFGADVDYGQIVKFYDADPIGPGRYAPPRVTGVERTVVTGSPDKRLISTSMVERQNLTMRMSMRRFTRLTNAFSKKLENLQAAVALHFAHYNLVRVHKSLRITPAMAANVTDRLWPLEELVEHTSK
jgi:hypothetical protein